MGGQKFDHVAVEQRRLLDLAGMAGAVEDLQFAVGDALLQRESGAVRVVLGAVNLATRAEAYFDNDRHVLGHDHVRLVRTT